jgi:hypothetical protein
MQSLVSVEFPIGSPATAPSAPAHFLSINIGTRTHVLSYCQVTTFQQAEF